MDSAGIGALVQAGLQRAERSQEGSAGTGFADTLRDVIAKTNEEQLTAESETQNLVSGEGDIVETMIAIGRAEVSMRFVVSLRNRALDAYQEIMRLQV